MRLCTTIGLVLMLSRIALADDSTALPKPLQWTINGEQREAIVIFPETRRKSPAPVVFAFHGHGGTMEAIARRWDIHKLWPEAVAIYPQGLPTPSRVDPEGKKAGWQSEAGTQGDRDLKLVDAILETVSQRHAIDNDRVYVAGHSNGGVFTYLLWLERPTVFAAYGPCSTTLRNSQNVKLEPAPVIHIAGENDNIAPFDKQMETMKKVREINGCKDKPSDWDFGCKLYSPKTDSGEPLVTFIHPGGHGLPLHSLQAIVKFFKEHPRHRSTRSTSE